MANSILKSRRAEVLSLVIVFAVIAILGAGAYILGKGQGMQITGFVPYTDGCNGSIIATGAYTVPSLLCGTDWGINISVGNVILDCSGNTISGSGLYGINVSSGISNVEIRNCIITGFAAGILVDAKTGTTSNINITNNVIDGTSSDVDFGSGALSNVYLWQNSFHGKGVSNSAQAVFCRGNTGNFYRSTIPSSSRGATDCGYARITNRTGGSFNGLSFYNITNLTFNWTAQSSSPNLPITYYLEMHNGTNWETISESHPDTWVQVGMDGVISSTQLEFRVTPYDGSYNGTYNTSGKFYVSNDADNDGFSLLDIYREYDAWDCNDGNSMVHQPSDRENDTSTESSALCYDTIDDDCDSSTDWLDSGCGHGFSVGSFDSRLYVNGSIRNISTSLASSGGNYVLVNNSYGMVEYFTETDLSGVDLSTVFTIQHGVISGDPIAYSGEFNKAAKLTFRNLTYKRVPLVLVDGAICLPSTNNICTGFSPDPANPYAVFTGNISFTAAHFSTFNVTGNAQIAGFTQDDSVASFLSSTYPKAIETYHRVRFFANYSRTIDTKPVNNLTGGVPDVNNAGSCNITISYPNGTAIPGSDKAKMEYDSYYGVYWFEAGLFNFTAASNYYKYNVSCNSTLFEPLSVSEYFSVSADSGPPERPVLYPQILLYPTNLTDKEYTYVAGYFGESDINFTLMVLHGAWSWFFNGSTEYTDDHSEYKGDDIVVNFAAVKGQNVTFTSWNQDVERALQQFRYFEFSNHNRTYFKRYYIVRSNRTGDDIRIESNESWEKDIPIGATMRIYNAPFPSGYFIQNVSLFGGSNRIAAWGDDAAGNSGNATHDWINAPYPDTAPIAPVLWPLPEVIRGDSPGFSVIGFLNETIILLNMSVEAVQGDYINVTWMGPSEFRSSILKSESPLSQDRSAGVDFFYISEYYYNVINSSLNWSDVWVDFSGHNMSYWIRYNVTNATKYPGQDARVYIVPNLTVPVYAGSTASFYNDSHRQGWFNMTIGSDKLLSGNNTVYAVGFRGSTEGYPSVYQYVYRDSAPPIFNLSGVPNFTNTRTPTLVFSVSDDYKVNISSLWVNISNSSWNAAYAFNSTALNYTGIGFAGNISCNDTYGDRSVYLCALTLNRTENGTYGVNYTVYDLAGWQNSTNKSLTVLVTTVDILKVEDGDDITNDIWLYFNWTSSSGELEYYEFALGTAKYPDSGYDSVKGWSQSCSTTANYTLSYVNFTHDSDSSGLNCTELKMKTGTVYYLTVRALNRAGEFGGYNSSDGILFIDNTPPIFRYISDNGPWTNSNSLLSADWLFEDNESDIIEYTYTIGNATYPNSGYSSVVPPTTTVSASVVMDSLSLVENRTYYFNVKAKNGNSGVNYSGSYSPWYSSPGIRVDTYPPVGGSVSWTNSTYITSGFVTIQYNVGVDDPGASDNVKGLIQYGRAALVYDVCPGVSDFDWYNTSDLLTGASYRDVNVSSGYCYVFRLFAWDNASNGVTYVMQNETLRVIKIDQTPPTDVAPVVDDGFFTNDRSSLHANWNDAADSESGFDHYYWRIVEQPVAGYPFCVVNTSGSVGTNCTEVAGGNTTVSEVSLNNLNLTHNHKYYFEVRAWNRAGLNSTTRYSDGIIYIDNAAPSPVVVHNVNEDNESSSPYYTEVMTGEINVTAYGDLDGYYDTAACVLLAEDIDYSENSSGTGILGRCSLGRVLSNKSDFTLGLTNLTVKWITEINCTNITNYTGGNALQGNYSWYVSCRDPYWNAQAFSQNSLVEFVVDWPEAPYSLVSSGNLSLPGVLNESFARPVFGNDDIYCMASVWDPDHYPGSMLNSSNITFVWKRNGLTVATHSRAGTDPDMDGVYNASDSIEANYTYRGNSMTCEVNASDERGLSRVNSSALVVSNTMPYGLELIQPNGRVINGNSYLSWIGPYDDVDDDSILYVIEIDNETGFSSAGNPGLYYNAPYPITVNNIALPGTQSRPDVWNQYVVYQDNRSGNSDIYLYNWETKTEMAVATSPGEEFNPQVYYDYVLYEVEIDSLRSALYKYTISTAVTSLLLPSINRSSMDFFWKYAAYNDGSGLKYVDVFSGSSAMGISSMPEASSASVFGNDIAWSNSSDGRIWIYDLSNRSAVQTGWFGASRIFGWFISNEHLGSINVSSLRNYSTVLQLQGSAARMHNGKIVYSNGTDIIVNDILNAGVNASLGAGSNPAVSFGIVAFERGDDIYIAEQNRTLPRTFMFENQLSPSMTLGIVTGDSADGVYYWRMQGCDNSFAGNSCVWGRNGTSVDPLAVNYTSFTIDNTPPVISGISPADGSVVAGQFRIYANIADNRSAVSYANYSVSFSGNGTVLFSGVMNSSGTLWSSGLLDFLAISLSNFTLLIFANDSISNSVEASVNFTVNNATPWFLFGGRGGTEIMDGTTIFNNSIDSDFVAFTVNQSVVRIVGPLPSTAVRFVQSKLNATVTSHNYSDQVSVATWPDGIYRVELNGTNHDGTNRANRTFYVDQNAPKWSNNRTWPGTVFANDSLVLSVNWTDITLDAINFTYNNTDLYNGTLMSQVIDQSVSQGVFNSSGIGVAAYINRTFYWSVGAKDRLNRTNVSGWLGVFVNDNAPESILNISSMSTLEDTINTSVSLDLSSYFRDVNTIGAWSALDNITYVIYHNCTSVAFGYSQSSGIVSSITSSANYTGYCSVYVNATDYYGKSALSNSFMLFVAPVNDPPSISPVPVVYTTEDNSTSVNYALASYVYDIDGDSVNMLVPEYNASVFNLTAYSLASRTFNFTLRPDEFGLHNITFRVSDVQYTTRVNATVNITGVNDAPVPGNFTDPVIGSARRGTFTIVWNAASDKANENQPLTYYLSYSTDGGSSWAVIADYAVLQRNTSYFWNSVLQFAGEANLTLRLNVSDGVNTSQLVYGNFTLDNLAPQLSIYRPRTTDVGTSITSSITSHESAGCIFGINGSASLSPSSTSGVTSHAISISSLLFNRTYNLSMSCTDAIGNTNVTYRLFEPRASALEFIRSYGVPSWVYQGQVVNLTLEIAANNTVNIMSMNIISPSGATQALSEADFSPAVNENNKFAMLNGNTVISTAEIGRYNLSITLLRTSDLISIGPLPVQAGIFDVFEAVNQTLNIV
jgi:beta propeller repeat protein